jgi:23S rRNA (guanosine2251-2'-O)-methyltransferase
MKRLFGKKALLEVIDSTDIISVELTSNNNELIEILNRKGIRYSIKNKNFFNQHFPKEFNHQGVVINLKDGKQNSSIEELLHEQKDKSVVVIVDSINDPQNFGAIIRTCAAFNVDAVIYKERNQVQITDFVAKSSMGGIAKVNMIKVSNLSNAIELLKKSGY